jgi:hypothetical protein
MAYIVKRKDLHHVVAYDGVDPLTGRERRRWHPAGVDSRDADSLLVRPAELAAFLDLSSAHRLHPPCTSPPTLACGCQPVPRGPMQRL